jgi:hypothetical protein
MLKTMDVHMICIGIFDLMISKLSDLMIWGRKKRRK